MEIERKYVPPHLPGNIGEAPFKELVQGYLCTDPAVRVRSEGNSWYLTYKGPGLIVREEYNLPLTEESFRHLLAKCDGNVIRKTRYLLPVDNRPDLTAELDVFHENLEGLLLLEVEFRSAEDADSFRAPDWFGKDVTGDPRFQNSSLSKGGPVPHVPQE